MQPATRFWIGIYSFTAVIMAIAVGVFVWVASESRKQAGLGRTANARPSITGRIPEERYELLSRFVPPGYEPTRGLLEPREFQWAMERYLKGDDAGAIPGFRKTVQIELDWDSAEARFYLAICLLLTNDRREGIDQLGRVVAARNTLYLERARFYLAKALIGQRDIPEARQQLEAVIAMHGQLEKEAGSLRAQITPGR
jgi:hypothetical protein